MANEFKVKKGLIVDGSNTVLDIQGTQGQLFSVTDSLTGDLFSVSDVSGIPILNVNSSGDVDIDGALGIGATASQFHADADDLVVGAGSGNTGITIHSGTSGYGSIFFADGTANDATEKRGQIRYLQGTERMDFHTDNVATAALSLAANGNATFAGDVGMATGHSSGKFAVMSTGVHGSYDFYNNGTTYLNGAVTIDHNLDMTSDGVIKMAGTEVISATRGISATTGTFAGTVLIDGVSNYTGLTLKGTGASRPALSFRNGNQSYLGSIYGTEGRALIFESGGDGTTGVVSLTLNSSGNATFAGNVAVQQAGDVYLTLESTDASTAEEVAIKYSNQSTGSNYWWAGLNQSANYSLAYGTSYSGANVKMEISTAGDATFAGKIKTTSTATGAIELVGGTGVSTTGAFILRQNGNGAGNGMAITSGHATSHRIWKDATGNLNIGSSGNADAFKQDITGNVTIEGNITLNTGTAKKLSILASTHDTNTAQTATLELGYTHSGGAAAGNIVLTEAANNAFDADMTFGLPYNNGSGGSTTRTALTLDGGTLAATFAGNVTIGDNSASEIFLAFNSSATDFALGANGSNFMIGTSSDLDSGNLITLSGTNGRLGIGTVSPGAKLDINSSSFWINPADGSHAGLHFRQGGIFKGFVGYNDTNDVVNFSMDGSIAKGVNVNVAGQVGVGDSSPTLISANTYSLSVNSSRTDLSGGLITKANGSVKHQQYWDSSGYSFNLSANAGDFKWNVNGNSRMVVDKDGGLDIQGTAGQLFSVTNSLSGDLFSVSDVSGIPIFNINSSGLSNFDGNVLVGKTAVNNALVGVQLMTDGSINPTVSGDTVARFNRLSSDGEVIRIQKDTATVGAIGCYNGVPWIGYQGGAGGGIMFNGASIEPTLLGSSRSSNTNDIGSVNYKWRYGYFGTGLNTHDLVATNSTVLSGPGSGTSNVLAVNHGAGSHTGIGIKITSANSGHALDLTGTVGSGYARITTAYNNLPDFTISGTITAGEDVIAYSDIKLKENIKTLDGSKVYDMRGVSFTRKDTEKEGSGVIAQEMQKVAPELVNEVDGTLGVSYGNITGYLIEAIKDLKAEVEQLKKQIK